MTTNYSICIKDGITTIRFLKPPTLADIRSAITKFLESYRTKFRIYDLSCGVDLTVEEIDQLVRFITSKNYSTGKLAIVAPKDLAYGLVKILDFKLPLELEFDLDVFRSVEDAAAWLNGGLKD
jgi:hypothetical protein